MFDTSPPHIEKLNNQSGHRIVDHRLEDHHNNAGNGEIGLWSRSTNASFRHSFVASFSLRLQSTAYVL